MEKTLSVMREIKVEVIKNTVIELAQKANFVLRPDAQKALVLALRQETNAQAKRILQAILDNARLAKSQRLAICQDTGLPVVFVEIGQEAHIAGGSLQKAISSGIQHGYIQGNLRNSIVGDPLLRGLPRFTPPIIHTEITPGQKIKITVLPKGFGCENKSQVKMFNPTVGIEEIKKFILSVVSTAGPDACPPFVVGVGIGGTQDYACLLAKKALLRNIAHGQRSTVHRIGKDILKEINALNIGPMGLGGNTTCLGVNIETYPTHIAGLPVAVNISCHALRAATKVI